MGCFFFADLSFCNRHQIKAAKVEHADVNTQIPPVLLSSDSLMRIKVTFAGEFNSGLITLILSLSLSFSLNKTCKA